MRDCPACRVPLHGYEEVCPSCGTRQMPTRGGGGGRVPYGAAWKPQEPGVNMVPFVLAFLGFAVFFLVTMQGTWVGQLMRQGPREADPMEQLTFVDARNIIDSELNKNLAAVGATNSKLTWHAPGSVSGVGTDESAAAGDPRTVDGPIELTVDTTLPQPDLRRQVVDPIKPYMDKAKLFTLNMNDSRSHAHWTYTMTPGVQVDPQAGLE